MPDRFDPYRKWLGIPPADQPPDHYRLLGIGRFEDDLDTISNAADRQMAHVRTFQAGPNSALSQKLLNEISAARICLLNSAKKAEYDRVLRAKEASQPAPVVERSPPVVEGSPPVVEGSPTTPLRPTEGLPTPAPPGLQPIPVGGFPSSPSPINLGGRPHSLRYAPPKKKLPALGIAVGGACLLAAVIAVIMVLNRGEPENTQPLARNLRDTDATPGKTSTDAAAPTQAGKPTAASDRAAPKLEIIKAEWGAGDRWQDITQRVRSLIYDERLVATAWGSFYAGVPDPEFGAPKHVRISYRAAGEPGEADLADGDFIYLDGRRPSAGQPSSAGLEIVEALYGAGTTWIDVLPRVRRWVHDDRLAVRVGLVAQTDPAPGQRKALFVRYRKPDGEFAAHAWDSEELALDARPLDAEGNPLGPHLAAALGEVVDLFRQIDPKLDAVAGDWQLTDEGLMSPSGDSTRLGVPYSLFAAGTLRIARGCRADLGRRRLISRLACRRAANDARARPLRRDEFRVAFARRRTHRTQRHRPAPTRVRRRATEGPGLHGSSLQRARHVRRSAADRLARRCAAALPRCTSGGARYIGPGPGRLEHSIPYFEVRAAAVAAGAADAAHRPEPAGRRAAAN